MARLIALEWDSREARVVAASTRGERMTVDAMFAVSLQPAEEGERVDVGARLADAFRAQGVGRGPATVLLSRSSVELKPLSLPPSPDEELPEMVRLQSLREFNALGDEWPLDFYPLSDDPEEPRSVLAAAVSPEAADEVATAVRAAGCEPGHLALRPCSVASLFQRQRPGDREPQLLVDLLPGEANLTVVADGRVVFTRTARISGDMLEAGEPGPLVAELRRTLAAVNTQLGGRRVEGVWLAGATPQHQALAERIGSALSLTAQTFDPLEAIELNRQVQSSPPASTDHFAALLGAVLDEAHGTRPALDFLNPRQPPAPPSRRRQWALIGAVVLLLIALGVTLVMRQLGALDEQIAKNNKLIGSFNAKTKINQDLQKEVDTIDAWLASDVTWLDELDLLSQRAPSPEDTMLLQMQMNALPKSGGEIVFKGLAKDQEAFENLNGVGDEHRRLEVKNRTEEQDHPLYAWVYNASVIIDAPNRRPAAENKQPAATPSKAAKPDAAEEDAEPTDPEAEPEDGDSQRTSTKQARP